MKHKRLIALFMTLLCVLSLCACGDKNQNKTEFTEFTDEEIATMIPDYSEHIVINDYTNITYDILNDYTVGEDDIEKGMINALPGLVIQTEVTDRPAEIGDTVNISYTGTVNGETFNGSQTPEGGTTIVLGYTGFVDNFEDKLVGMSIGETRTIEINYPENYGNPDINGKTATFEVTMNSIYEYTLPELTDEMIQANSTYTSVEEMRTACENTLMQEYQYRKENELMGNILEQLVANTTINSYPEDEINAYIDRANKVVEDYAEMYNMTSLEIMQSMYGVSTPEEFTEIVRNEAQEYIENKMILCAFARVHNITVTAQQFDEFRNQLLADLNVPAEEILSYYSEEELLYDCLVVQIQNWALEQAGEIE